MPEKKPNLKGFTEENWAKRWEIVEKIVELAREDRAAGQLSDEFKLDRDEVANYLKIIANNKNDDSYIGAINNSIVAFKDKIIIMDHNPGSEDYNQRYIGMGRFGKVKLGMDKEGTPYALKVERQKNKEKSKQEMMIMKKIGVLIGTISYETKTQKPWIDKQEIHAKELRAMTLIQGDPLFQYFDPTSVYYNKFTYMQNMLIALGIVRAIDALNENGVAHRDSNLSNFMIDTTQFPPDLSIHNVTEYLKGSLPGYDFTKLIREIDWGLSCEIPIDGSFINLGKVTVSVGHMAPEYYTDQVYSRFSEIYAIAILLKRDLMLYDPIISSICPKDLTDAVRNFETENENFNAFVRKFNSSSPTVKTELIAELQKLNTIKEASRQKLKAILTLYPPEQRPSLSTLSSYFEASIKTRLAAIQEATARPAPVFHSSNTSVLSSSGGDYLPPISSSLSASSTPSPTAFNLQSQTPQPANNTTIPEDSVPSFSHLADASERNEFISSICLDDNVDTFEKMIQAQSLEDLREMVSFINGKDFDQLLSMLIGDFEEKIGNEISKRESLPSP